MTNNPSCCEYVQYRAPDTRYLVPDTDRPYRTTAWQPPSALLIWTGILDVDREIFGLDIGEAHVAHIYPERCRPPPYYFEYQQWEQAELNPRLIPPVVPTELTWLGVHQKMMRRASSYSIPVPGTKYGILTEGGQYLQSVSLADTWHLDTSGFFKAKNICYEYNRLSGWNTTLEAACYVRHAFGRACYRY